MSIGLHLIFGAILVFVYIYLLVRIKMYVDSVTNALEEYIDGIKDVIGEAFKKLGDRGEEEK